MIRTPKIVFRYSELNCNVCVNQELKNLKDIALDIGHDKILILASFSLKRDLYLFKKHHKIDKFKIYNISELKLNLEIEKYNKPYVFYCEDKLIKLLLVSKQEKNILSETFYKKIKKRYEKVQY